MTKIRARLIQPLVLAALALWSAVAVAREVVVSQEVRANQALANVQAWIKTHPNDAAGYCALGRVHALAWAYGDKIPLVGAGGAAGGTAMLPSFSEASTVLVSRTGPTELLFNATGIVPGAERKDRPVTADDAAHLAAAIAAYRKAIELDPHDALSELGLGWMLAQQGVYARDLPVDYFGNPKLTDADRTAWNQAVGRLADPDPIVRDTASKTLLAAMPRCVLFLREVKSDDPESQARIDAALRGHFELQALDPYRKAFDLRATADLQGEPTYQTDSQVSAKAGAQILAVLGRHPEVARKDESKTVQKVLDPLAKKMEHLMSMPQ